MAVDEYIKPIAATKADTLILGCTHYPLLEEAITESAGSTVQVVDSAKETARQVAGIAKRSSARRAAGRCYLLASDNPDRFAEIGSRFMGEKITKVFYVDPEEFIGAQQPGPGTRTLSSKLT